MRNRVLVVDDDVETAGLLVKSLAAEQFQADVVHDGEQAVRKVLGETYTLVLLDVTLPGMSGFEVLMAIRTKSQVPVIMLTGRSDTVDRVLGLKLGADDYLTKPFHARELMARIEAVLRRSQAGPGAAEADGDVIAVDDVRIDVRSRAVECSGQPVELTTGEFDVLVTLAREAGEIVSRETLYTTALGRRYSPFDRSLDNHISSLRKKMGDTSDGKPRIRTVRNSGYLFARSSTTDGRTGSDLARTRMMAADVDDF